MDTQIVSGTFRRRKLTLSAESPEFIQENLSGKHGSREAFKKKDIKIWLVGKAGGTRTVMVDRVVTGS